MKIFIICSKHFYHRIEPIQKELENMGHVIALPNSYENPMAEEEYKLQGEEAHREFKSRMMRLQAGKVSANDAVLALNFEKNGQENYIGGATFMEIVKAFELDKKIFLYNPIPNSIFTDELKGMNPKVINGDLTLVV